jgi:hypothetical protein
MTKPLLIALVGAPILISAIYLNGAAAESAATAIPSVDFHGKVVMLVLSGSSVLDTKGNSEVLDSPVLEKIGERLFIVGKAHISKSASNDSEDDWRDGASVGISWDRVQSFYAYTPEQFEKADKKINTENK